MRFFSLLVLSAALLPDLYFWSKLCILYSNFYSIPLIYVTEKLAKRLKPKKFSASGTRHMPSDPMLRLCPPLGRTEPSVSPRARHWPTATLSNTSCSCVHSYKQFFATRCNCTAKFGRRHTLTVWHDCIVTKQLKLGTSDILVKTVIQLHRAKFLLTSDIDLVT